MDLPVELLQLILYFACEQLSPSDMCSARLVCQKWHDNAPIRAVFLHRQLESFSHYIGDLACLMQFISSRSTIYGNGIGPIQFPALVACLDLVPPKHVIEIDLRCPYDPPPLSSYRISSGAFVSLCFALRSNKTVRKLCASDCNLDPDSGAAVALMLRENTSIEVLDLSRNRLGDSGVSAIVEALITGAAAPLRSLDLYLNIVSHRGIASITALIGHDLKSLETLCVGGFAGPFPQLGSRIGGTKFLTHLALPSCHFLQIEDWKALSEGIAKSISLQVLSLMRCQIYFTQLQEMMRALFHSRVVHTLNLRELQVVGGGYSPIAAFLRDCPTTCSVRCLDLSSCRELSDSDLVELFGALQRNRTIETLILKQSRGGMVLAMCLSDCLEFNTTLRSLTMGTLPGFLPGRIDFAALAPGLSVNKGLTHLSLREPQAGEEMSQALAEILGRNSSLTRLVLHHCNLADSDAAKLVTGLLGNKTLRVLDLSNNEKLTVDGLNIIRNAKFSAIREGTFSVRI